MELKEAIVEACRKAAVDLGSEKLKELSWFYSKSLKKRP